MALLKVSARVEVIAAIAVSSARVKVVVVKVVKSHVVELRDGCVEVDELVVDRWGHLAVHASLASVNTTQS